jgi:hypothetical protein
MKAKALLLIVFLAGSAHGQTRRALLVGIDHYIRRDTSDAPALSLETKERLAKVQGRPSRSKISDPEGAVNDASQMRDLLISKYKFEARNIILLKDSEATADRILDTLQKHLVDGAKPGDVSFFYYAGHGSRIRNTLTRNPDGMDSTLVPADTLLGVPDIRSKELDRIYLQARKRNVEFTVVEDSCFSGAGIRGPRPANRTRATDSDDQVSVAEALEGPLPEEQGVLFFSASQDYQPAQELPEDVSSGKLGLGKHGAFTWAFLQILASVGENERVDRIFQRTRALMQSRVDGQEPVVLETGGRSERGLFGQPADPFGAATAAVGLVKPDRGMLELNSGVMMGLAAGSELKRIEPPGNPPVRIRITEVNGPGSANAVPIEPSQIGAIAAGNLFQLDKLVVPDKEFLKVYVGEAVPSAQLMPIVRLAADLRAGGGVELIDDPTENTPTHVLLWDAGKNGDAGQKQRKQHRQWILTENRFNGSVPMRSEAPSAGGERPVRVWRRHPLRRSAVREQGRAGAAGLWHPGRHRQRRGAHRIPHGVLRGPHDSYAGGDGEGREEAARSLSRQNPREGQNKAAGNVRGADRTYGRRIPIQRKVVRAPRTGSHNSQNSRSPAAAALRRYQGHGPI